MLGILRGARTREHAPAVMHSESTGNPRRDMEIQRLMSQSHLLNYDEQVSVSFGNLTTYLPLILVIQRAVFKVTEISFNVFVLPNNVKILLHFQGDEYAGLMTQKEKQWVVNIQLNQLKCENPFIVRIF